MTKVLPTRQLSVFSRSFFFIYRILLSCLSLERIARIVCDVIKILDMSDKEAE